MSICAYVWTKVSKVSVKGLTTVQKKNNRKEIRNK